MSNTTENLHFYKIVSPKIRHNRKLFYSLLRKFEEPIEKWLNRIETRINRCDFAKFSEYILLDKFFSELNKEEIDIIGCERQTWTIKQLRQYLWVENIDTAHIGGNATFSNNRNVKANEAITMDSMESRSDMDSVKTKRESTVFIFARHSILNCGIFFVFFL